MTELMEPRSSEDAPQATVDRAQGGPSVEAASGTYRVAAFAAVLLALAALWFLTAEPGAENVMWRAYSVQACLLNLAVTYAALCSWYYLLGGGQRRMRMFRIVLVSLPLGFCLAALELPAVALGHNYEVTFGNESSNTWLQLSGNINRADPELIHVHWPHSHYSGEVVGNLTYFGIAPMSLYPFDLRYDHNGFRNDEDLKSADIVAIGDSFVEATTIATPDTVVKQIEQRLGGSAANLGQSAYGLRQELAVLTRYGLPLKPKLVLWFIFGGNDLRDVGLYERQLSRYGETSATRPLKHRLFTRNALLAISRFTTPPRSVSSEEAMTRSGLFTRADGSRDRVYFGQTNGPWTGHEWQVTTETLRDAKAGCDKIGAKFAVVYISRKFRVYRDSVELAPQSVTASWTVNDLPRALTEWCASEGIGFVDTTPDLQRTLARGEHVCFVDDVHWNPKGHAVAADTVTRYVESLGWSIAPGGDSNP